MALEHERLATDVVNCGTLSSWNPTAFTICIWSQSYSGVSNHVMAPCTKDTLRFQYRIASGGDALLDPLNLRVLWVRTGGNLDYQTDDRPSLRDAWSFTAFTGNQSNSANDLVRIYVGGLSTPATAASLSLTNDSSGSYTNIASADFLIANNLADGDRAPGGRTASVCVINEELTLAQILTIQRQFSNAAMFDLVATWDLGLRADASSVQPDMSGNGHNTSTPASMVLADHVPLVLFPTLPGTLVATSGAVPTVINCTLGTVEVAGLTATVGAGTQVNASLGTIEVAGLTATVGAGTQVNASFGAIDVAGLTAGIGAGTQVNASLGAIEVAGLVATLPTGAVVDCGLGAIEVAGLVAGVGAGTQVNASLGAVEVAGLAASISAGRDIAVSLGTIEVAGHAVSGSSGQTLILNTGQFTVAGLPVSISAGTVIAVGLGAVQVAGLAATITNPQTVTASLGAVDVAGLPVSISAGTVLAVGVGAIDVLGLPVGVGAGTQVNASLGLVDVSGLPATVMAPSGPIGVTLGVIEISGHNVVIAISIGHTLGPESGVIETGPESGFIETGPELGLIEYNDIGVIE